MTSMLSMLGYVLDIAIVWAMFYFVIKSLRNNVKMVLIFKGIIFIIIIKILSDLLNLNTVGVLLEYIIEWGPLALIIIFQPEIRSVLENLGRTQLLGRHKTLTVDEREKVVFEIMQATEYLKKQRIGALIVIEKDYGLGQFIEPANKLYADISSELLISIFFPNNPLHDGGVIIQGDRITCAGSVFPTSMNPNISKRLGTRHRAALGLSEISDALCLIVSEETGRVSIAQDSELHYNLSLDETRMMLIEGLKTKTDTFYDADEEIELEDIGKESEGDTDEDI